MEHLAINGQDIVLDPFLFRSWLETRSPDEIVGYACDCGRCPVATWFFTQSGEACDVVGDWIGFIEDDEYQWVRVSDWIGEFVEFVDHASGYVVGEPITASEALAVFDQLRERRVIG